jgi:hypothetical protein
MGQLVEVIAVEVEAADADSLLLGASVDSPTAGREMAASALEIGGWALGRKGRPDVVEVAIGGEVLAQGAWREREDLALAFPDVGEATRAGFEALVDASTSPAEAELEVRARLGQQMAPFARIRLRRHWREELDPARTALISIVVLGEGTGERAIQSTLQSIGVQHHPLTEVLVLRSATSGLTSPPVWAEDGVRDIAATGNGSALRNEGIRRSNGELILFVEAGSVLAPDALALGVEMLTRKPDAVAVLDGNVAASLYRRAGFEELEGFLAAADDVCDLELAGRARRYGAFSAPGALVVGSS